MKLYANKFGWEIAHTPEGYADIAKTEARHFLATGRGLYYATLAAYFFVAPALGFKLPEAKEVPEWE